MINSVTQFRCAMLGKHSLTKEAKHKLDIFPANGIFFTTCRWCGISLKIVVSNDEYEISWNHDDI